MSNQRDFLVFLPVFALCYVITWQVLRQVKSRGIWTVGLGFVLLIVFSAIQIRLTGGNGLSPEGKGVALGCGGAALWWCLKHMGLLRPNK